MSKFLSRKNFMINLCKRGIPARYAWRVSKELNDHAEDLDKNQSESSLGDPNELLDQIELTYKQRTFAGRHPVLVFLMAPLPVVVIIYILTILLTYLGLGIVYELAYYASYPIDESSDDIGLVFHSSLILFPTVLSTMLIFRWARKSGIKLFYSVASCFPVFLMALLIVTKVLPSDAQHTARAVFGLNLPLGRWLSSIYGPSFGPADQPWPIPGFNQIMQFTISALVIFYMVHHEKVKQQKLAEKLVTTE